MFEPINEPIDVIAKFTANQTIPVKLLWRNREVMISKLNLTYSKREGRVKLYYFAVSDGSNYYKLQFNPENLIWTLLEVYVD